MQTLVKMPVDISVDNYCTLNVRKHSTYCNISEVIYKLELNKCCFCLQNIFCVIHIHFCFYFVFIFPPITHSDELQRSFEQ